MRVREPERRRALCLGIGLQAQHLLKLLDRARRVAGAKRGDRRPPQHVDAPAACQRHLVERGVDPERLYRLPDAYQIFREQPRGALAIAERAAGDVSGHDGAAALFDIRRQALAYIEPKKRDEDIRRFRGCPDAASGMQVRGSALPRSHEESRDAEPWPTGSLRGAVSSGSFQPLVLHVDGAPESRDAGQAIHDRVVVLTSVSGSGSPSCSDRRRAPRSAALNAAAPRNVSCSSR